MAAKVGTSVTGSATGASSSIASASKNTTTGNCLVAFVKWESTGAITSIADTAGNTWVLDQYDDYSGGEPRGQLAYALNITGNAANVVTVTFNSANPTFRRIIVQEWSGLATSAVEDGTSTGGQGIGTTYSAAAITTTTTGVMVAGVAGYTALSGIAAAGTPTATLDSATLSDTFIVYYVSGSAQSITPGASATSASDVWSMSAMALKDAVGGAANPKGLFGLALNGPFGRVFS